MRVIAVFLVGAALGLVAGAWREPAVEALRKAGEGWLFEEPTRSLPLGTQGRRRLADAPPARARLEQLAALGYVDGTPDPRHDRQGVLEHDPERAWQGLNFYNSRWEEGARLVDMEGRTLHEWRTPGTGPWQHATLLPDGSVVVLVKDRMLFRADADSRLLWKVPGRFHHDLDVHEGRIHALARTVERVPRIHPDLDVLVDRVVTVSMDGRVLDDQSILHPLLDSDYAFLLPTVAASEMEPGTRGVEHIDILHTNHVEVFDGSLEGRHPLYGDGNLLVSMRNLHAVAVIDPESDRVAWIWGPGNVTFQHHPTLLEDGDVLLFDNGTERSRILQIDPVKGSLAWSYGPRDDFFSATRGSNQRLPNGNTLITESDTGYVFEVTPEGERVWRFANPDVRRGRRQAIWRMTRVSAEGLDFLADDS